MRLSKITILLQCMVITLCISAIKANAQNNYSFITQQVKHKNSKGYLQENDKNEKNKLIDVLKDLNRSKGVYFMFSSRLLGEKVVNKVEDMHEDVEVILDKILKNTGLAYKKINSNTFVIVSIKDIEKEAGSLQNTEYSRLNSVGSQPDFIAPDALITGKVVDKNGAPIAGVSVSIKGEKRGTSTNRDGEFTIEAATQGIQWAELPGVRSFGLSVRAGF